MENPKMPHVLVLPYPGQGHVNPMIQFCRRLISKGLKTTLVTSVFISNSMNLGTSIGHVNLAVISDGFDDSGFPHGHPGGAAAYISKLRAAGSKTLAELIVKYREIQDPVQCIVYEPFLPWALDVAKEFGVAGAAFFTQPCVVDYIYYNIYNGLLELPVCSSSYPVAIPGLPELEVGDMPSFVGVPGTYPAYFQLVLNQFCNTDKADFILINTFYKLEAEAVDTMSKVCPNLLTIGPTVPSIYLDKRIEDDDNYYIDLFPSDASISTNWLTAKPPNSVIYVAFGSMADLSPHQMEELLWGLKRTNFYFLWSIRASEQSKLPTKFFQDLGDKGMVVNWSPQVKMLANEAVGCFFSHCGWNSTIEALSLGVPMVAMPQWTDQPPNAKLVEDVWKVGIRVRVDEEDGVVKREEVEFCVREVMEGERGKEMKRNAMKWRDLAIEAVSEGGTSDINIDQFVSKFLKL